MTATFDPYATLGIPVGSSRADAARAHRRLAKRYHPDVNTGPAAAERMRRINEAWRVLSDPTRRASYEVERRARSARTASATTWTTWPESRRPASAPWRRPDRRDPVEPSFGDRPAVVFAVTALLTLLYFIGAWLGSVAR